jgi:hypothetical protein
VRSGRASRAKLPGSLLLAAAIFASGGEPERLPYTVCDLPPAAPAATGQVTGLR